VGFDRRALTHRSWLPAAWLVGALLVWDGSNRGLSNTEHPGYGENLPGEAVRTLILLTVEVLVLHGILRPHSYRHSWRRALLALAAFAPWTFLYFVAGQHAGLINTDHLLWLACIVVSLMWLTMLSVGNAAGLRHPTIASASALGMIVLGFVNWLRRDQGPAWLSWTTSGLGIVCAAALAVDLYLMHRARASNESSGLANTR
jgi:hypothetical protein